MQIKSPKHMVQILNRMFPQNISEDLASIEEVLWIECIVSVLPTRHINDLTWDSNFLSTMKKTK